MTTREKAAAFFHEHAGWSYDPKTETEEHGRWRCARMLAQAEEWLRSVPHTIDWPVEESPDYSGIDHRGSLYGCVVRWMDEAGEWHTESLWNIDLGESGTECREYMRVVVAELACELMPE